MFKHKFTGKNQLFLPFFERHRPEWPRCFSFQVYRIIYISIAFIYIYIILSLSAVKSKYNCLIQSADLVPIYRLFRLKSAYFAGLEGQQIHNAQKE